MRVTYSGDAAYIYLTEIERGEAVAQLVIDDCEDAAASTIVLDFDKDGRLLGIEVLGARKGLPRDLLETAERPGRLAKRFVTPS